MKVNELTAKTLIPLSSIGIVATIIIWVSLTYARVETNTEKILEVKNGEQLIITKLDDISQRLAKIEGFLSHVSEHLLEEKKK